MTENKPMSGYPSIDKPWRKYYSEEEKNVKIPEGTMFDYMYERNVAYPNDIALEYYGRSFSYHELFKLIDCCCRNLSALGIKKGDIVTIQSLPLPQVIVMMYALNRIGACGNMLYPDEKAENIVHSMNKTDSHLLVVLDKILSIYEKDLPDSFNSTIILMNIADQMPFLPRLLIRKKAAYKQTNKQLHTITWREFISGEGESYLENHDNMLPAFMLRTGGTTGIPKEVVLGSRGFNAIAEATYYSSICKHWNRQKTSILLQPPFIAFGVGSGVHHPLSYGIKLVISLDVSPIAVSKLLSKYRPNYIIAGTVQIEQYMTDLEHRKDTLDYLDFLAVGGEAMSIAYEEKIQSFVKKHQCSVLPVKGYGLTETSASVIAETITAHKIGSVGIPLALCNMKIVDTETGEELTYNTPGEVCLSTPGIMYEYYHEQQATDEVVEIVDGERWLHTGDVGYISEDGLLTITGRIKRIITCREGLIYHKVFPLLIENQLSKIDGVQEITIIGKPDTDAGNVLVAYVVPEVQGQQNQAEKALREYCDSNFETFERPVEYVWMESLPRTLIGKVDYRKLEETAKENVTFKNNHT